MTQLPQNDNEITPELIDRIIKDKRVRIALTTQSHFWFFNVYFHEYVQYKTAPFQREIFELTENASIKNLVVVAFRGSGKTTIINQSYPIWAILGQQQKKFVVICAQTMVQARQILRNIKEELENNELLRNDLGPFKEEEIWNASSLYFTRQKARIVVASKETSIRGIKHGAYRPDLIILDDVEDIASVKTQESRDNTYQWVTGDIMPLGDKHTRLIFIGNLLHEDSLLMRLRQGIEQWKLSGQFRFYPLVDENEQILWPGKYPTHSDIEELKHSLGNEVSFQREYMLNIIPDDSWIVQPEWIQYYDELPPMRFRDYACIGIDLAISKEQTADYTAMVPAIVTGRKDTLQVYILPQIVNKRLTFLEGLEQAKLLSESIGNGSKAKLYVEDVAYQRSFEEVLSNAGFPAKGVQLHGQDKRARLTAVAYLLQAGKVFFPRVGAELLIQQILHFGVEKRDDLADAFSILLSQIIKEDGRGGYVITGNSYRNDNDWNHLNSRAKHVLQEKQRNAGGFGRL